MTVVESAMMEEQRMRSGKTYCEDSARSKLRKMVKKRNKSSKA